MWVSPYAVPPLPSRSTFEGIPTRCPSMAEVASPSIFGTPCDRILIKPSQCGGSSPTSPLGNHNTNFGIALENSKLQSEHENIEISGPNLD